MKTKAVRLYGKEDLRLEEFELPAMKEDEILAKVVSDSICMSSYKSSHQGTDHKRVPNDIAEHPTIIKMVENVLRKKAEARHYAYTAVPHDSKRYRFVALNEIGRLLVTRESQEKDE